MINHVKYISLIASSLLLLTLPGCGGVYRVDPVFTTSKLPSINSPKDDFYRGDQVNINGTAFNIAFQAAHATYNKGLLESAHITLSKTVNDTLATAIAKLYHQTDTNAMTAKDSIEKATKKVNAAGKELKQTITRISDESNKLTTAEVESLARISYARAKDTLELVKRHHIKDATDSLNKALLNDKLKKQDKEAINQALYELENVQSEKMAQYDDEEAKNKRNELIDKVLLLADHICLQHKSDIYGTAAGLNLTLGTATTLFSGAASLATGTKASTLSALAAASNSTRSLVNEEVYRNAFAAALLSAIDKARQSVKTSIMTGMKASTTEYPIEMAMQQLDEYHRNCSFIAGIQLLSTSIQQRQKTKSQILSEIDYLDRQIGKNSHNTEPSAKSANAELIKERTRLQKLYLNAPE